MIMHELLKRAEEWRRAECWSKEKTAHKIGISLTAYRELVDGNRSPSNRTRRLLRAFFERVESGEEAAV